MSKPESRGITVVELVSFRRDADKIFTQDEYDELVTFIALNPLCGDLIPATGGMRKVRWGAQGSGKRSGARVVYFFYDMEMPIFLLAVYAKSEKDDLSTRERELMHRIVEAIMLERAKKLQATARGLRQE